MRKCILFRMWMCDVIFMARRNAPTVFCNSCHTMSQSGTVTNNPSKYMTEAWNATLQEAFISLHFCAVVCGASFLHYSVYLSFLYKLVCRALYPNVKKSFYFMFFLLHICSSIPATALTIFICWIIMSHRCVASLSCMPALAQFIA